VGIDRELSATAWYAQTRKEGQASA
jgi:hypothetical protein